MSRQTFAMFTFLPLSFFVGGLFLAVYLILSSSSVEKKIRTYPHIHVIYENNRVWVMHTNKFEYLSRPTSSFALNTWECYFFAFMMFFLHL